MSYLIPFYHIPLVDSLYVCLIITLWMSDSQNNAQERQYQIAYKLSRRKTTKEAYQWI